MRSIGLHDSQRYHKPDWPTARAAARRHRPARSRRWGHLGPSM